MGSVGYKGKASELLIKYGIKIGESVNIHTSSGKYSGILLPRYELFDNNHVVIKLRNGYNIGIDLTKIKSIDKIDIGPQDGILFGRTTLDDIDQPTERHTHIDEPRGERTLPKVALISTGGTIGSKIDYRTGGVTSVLSASDLYVSVPEISRYASIDTEMLLNEYSENLRPEHWTLMADNILEKLRLGTYDGIILSHGTDTMHYTAAALSFALHHIPIPVILTGAQRSSDRPSSDAALNLVGATKFAVKSKFSGVFIVMHADASDNLLACHLGTRVRKNHTSSRDAFESIDIRPVALINGEKVEMQQNPGLELRRRGETTRSPYKTSFDKHVILLKYYPGFDPKLILYLVRSGYKAIILEGTGLGHISNECFAQLRQAIESGVMIFMTSQCIWGRVNMNVYDTGRDLLGMGVIPLSDMTPETALVKAMWLLANIQDSTNIKKMMQENMCNEISSISPIQ